MSSDRGISKEDVVHFYNRILLTHNKEGNKPSAAIWMDLETVTWSEVGQTERQISCDIVYMWNLKQMVQVSLFTKQK